MQVIPAEIEDPQEINHIKTEAYRDEKKRFEPWQTRKEGEPDWIMMNGIIMFHQNIKIKDMDRKR